MSQTANLDTDDRTEASLTNWIDRFDGLKSLPDDTRSRLARGSRVRRFPEGAVLFEPGQEADRLLLLLSGTVRVQQSSDQGREVFLYRVNAGESCVLTTACMLAFEDYATTGIAETPVLAAEIPRGTFDALVAESRVFREFVFRAYARRITDLFTLIDDIVFQRLDVRLAGRLVELADDDGVVHATHQVLGTELGTAREVISRLLSDFQKRGLVKQARGAVCLLDREALDRLARGGER